MIVLGEQGRDLAIHICVSIAQLLKNPPVNAGDTSLIPGSGRSPGEGIGYPLQYSSAYLVAQTVKNPPAMWETWL